MQSVAEMAQDSTHDYGESRRKNFSHGRSNFPFAATRTAQQGMGEFQPEKVVTLAMGDANNLRAQVA